VTADRQTIKTAFEARNKLRATKDRCLDRTTELVKSKEEADDAYVKTLKKGHEIHIQLELVKERYKRARQRAMTSDLEKELDSLKTRYADALRRRQVVRNVILGLLVESGIDWSDETSQAGKLYTRITEEGSWQWDDEMNLLPPPGGLAT